MEVPKYYYLSNAVIEGNTYTYVHQNTSLADRLPFRIGGLGRIVHSRGFFDESYKQGNFVLYCILSGEGTLEYDGRTYLIKPGDFMFLDRDLRLAMYTGTQLDAYFIHCNGTSCKDYYNACYHGNFRPVTHPAPSLLHGIFQFLISVCEKSSEETDILISNQISMLLTELYNITTAQSKQKSGAQPDWLLKCVEYINTHYMKKISIKDLCAISFVCGAQISRNFRTFFNVSPYDYILNVRIHHAKRYLSYTTKKIDFIANEVGFTTVSNFIKMFRQKTGYTPKQYRILRTTGKLSDG